jgi:MFS family permease
VERGGVLGIVGGPILGGSLIAWFWWGAVFLINVPIVVLAIIAAVVLMPESRGPWQKDRGRGHDGRARAGLTIEVGTARWALDPSAHLL